MSLSRKTFATALALALTACAHTGPAPDARACAASPAKQEENAGFTGKAPPVAYVPTVRINPEYPRAFRFGLRTQPVPGNAVDVLRQLDADATAGDKHAYYRMFRTLERCRTARRSEHERLLDAWDRAESSLQIDKNEFVDYSEQAAEDCKGLDAQQTRMGPVWLFMGAESGDIEAQLGYARSLHLQYPTTADQLRDAAHAAGFKRKALDYAAAAASAGSIDAIDYLASYYYDGEMADPNPLLALAYMDAYAAVVTTAPADPRRRQLAARMDDIQLQLARNETARILQGCCR